MKSLCCVFPIALRDTQGHQEERAYSLVLSLFFKDMKSKIKGERATGWNALGISNFLEDISNFFPFYCFLLFLCNDHWGRLFYLSLLFSGTLHSNGYIFPLLLCFSLLFFSQLFVRPPQTTILLFCISFSWGWFRSLPPVKCYETVHSYSGTLSSRSNPLNLILWIYSPPLPYNHKGFDLGHTWMV